MTASVGLDQVDEAPLVAKVKVGECNETARSKAVTPFPPTTEKRKKQGKKKIVYAEVELARFQSWL